MMELNNDRSKSNFVDQNVDSIIINKPPSKKQVTYVDVSDGDKSVSQKSADHNLDRSHKKQSKTKSGSNSEGGPFNYQARKRKSLVDMAAIVPAEDKFQKLKNVKLAGFAFVAKTTNWYARIFWIILILLAFAFLAYEVYRTIADFINNPVITTYVLKPQSEIEFPKIFICPSVVVNASFYLQNKRKTESVLNMLKTVQNLGKNQTADFSDTSSHQQELDGGRMSGQEISNYVTSMGLDVESFFVSCNFYSNTSQPVSVQCSDIVRPLIDHKYGKCFQIIVGQNQTSDGKGLQLMINSHSKSESIDTTSDSLIIKPYQGVFVNVDSKYQPASLEKILVSAGSYTKMALSLTHLKLLNLLSGALIQPCADDDHSKLTILDTRYTLSSCNFDCVLQEIKSACKCLPVLESSILQKDVQKSIPICTSDDYKNCIQGNISVSQSSNDNINTCQSQCQSPCDDWRYAVSSSSAPLNPAAFKNLGGNPNNNNNGSSVVDQLILLDIAFNRVELIEFEQTSSMTFDFFVGNMGSQITLWIGGCMLTLLPIPLSFLAFCVMACIIKITKAVRKNE